MALIASCLGRKYVQMNVPVFILCDLTHSHITGLCTKLVSYKLTIPLLLVMYEVAFTSKMFQSHHKCQKFSMPTVYFNSVTIYLTIQYVLTVRLLNIDKQLTFFLSLSWVLSGAVEGLSGRLDMGFVGELFLLFSFSFSSLEIDLESQKIWELLSHNFHDFACFMACCISQVWWNMKCHNRRIIVVKQFRKLLLPLQ